MIKVVYLALEYALNPKLGTFAVKSARFLLSLIKQRGRGELITYVLKSDSLLLFYCVESR